jgi:uncharacterized membrane protein
MLTFYRRWARRLYPWRWVFIVIFLLSVLSFGWLLFIAPAGLAQRWQLSSVFAAIMGLLLWLWSTVFLQPPAIYYAQLPLWQRLRVRIQHALYYLLALVITLLLIAITYLGLRIVKGIIADLFFS